jgi:probable HAF family extracellular repeat protein
MRNVVRRTALVLLLSCVLPLQTMGFRVRAESSELPSTWTVTVYGDRSHFLIPKSINNNGVATAQLQTPDGFFPVELSGGQIVTLGDGTVQGAPTGINDQGVIVGYSIDSDGSTSAAVFAPGSVTELNVGAAWDIDESGTIVGSVNGVAAYWPQGEAPLALASPTDEESAQVLAINENGLMVGTADTHAVAWRDGQVVNAWYTPGNASKQFVLIDVNDAGKIIGEIISTHDDASGQENMTYVPLTLQDEKPAELPMAAGDTSCEVDAINNSGWIAGACGHGEAQHAILWVDSQIIEIGPLLGDGWQAVVATDVNDNGQIIGQGILNGVVAVFILTPA